MEEMGEVLAQERWDEGVPQRRWGGLGTHRRNDGVRA